MGFEELRFFNFRNLCDRELLLDGAREVFLVGENGQGKTNLLEAVHLLCVGSSFREPREAALVRDEASPAGLAGRYAAPPARRPTSGSRSPPGGARRSRWTARRWQSGGSSSPASCASASSRRTWTS